MPGQLGEPVVTTLVCFIYFAREAAGALGARHSPRPHGRRIHAQLGRIAPRDRGVVSGFIVIARSDLSAVAQLAKAEATKQSILSCAARWIASLALAMTVSCSDPQNALL